MTTIDLNADVGEGMDDAAILPFLTSVNVACGLHAGGPEVMDRTVALGRGRLRGGSNQPLDAVTHLIWPESAFPFYLTTEPDALARLAALLPEKTVLITGPLGWLGSRLVESLVRGLPDHPELKTPPTRLTVRCLEAFADRRYLPDGRLMPRKEKESVLTDPDEAAEQALHIARDGYVTTSTGTRLAVRAQTLCLHGDTPGAPIIARTVRERLEREGVRVAPLGSPVSEQ